VRAAVGFAYITAALLAGGSIIDAFTVSSSYQPRACSSRSFGSKSDKLSKKEQEYLVESNAPYFQDASIKHITSNTSPRSSWGRKLRKRAARPYLHGVEIRELQVPHSLHGQLGLFAATLLNGLTLWENTVV